MSVAFYSLQIAVILTYHNCYSSNSVLFAKVENTAISQSFTNVGIFTVESVTLCASICAARSECDTYIFNRNGTCVLMQFIQQGFRTDIPAKIPVVYMKSSSKPIATSTSEQFTTQPSSITSWPKNPWSDYTGSNFSWPSYSGRNTTWPYNSGPGTHGPGPESRPSGSGNNTFPAPIDKSSKSTTTHQDNIYSTNSPRKPYVQCTPTFEDITSLMTVINKPLRVSYIFFSDGTVCTSSLDRDTCETERQKTEDIFERIDDGEITMAFSIDSQTIILGNNDAWYWYITEPNEFSYSFKKIIDDNGQCESWLNNFIGAAVFNNTVIMFDFAGEMSCFLQTSIQQSLDDNNCQAIKPLIMQQQSTCAIIQTALDEENIEFVQAIEEVQRGTLTVFTDNLENCKIYT